MNFKGKYGPLLIAEIGGNHEGNFDIAIKQTKLAIHSGCDVVKYQMYRGESLVNPKEDYKRFKHFQKFELSKAQYIKLAKICKKNKVIFSASIWDIKMIEWVDNYLKFYKIGSGDLTAFPILDEFARRKKPIILSTGLSNLKEVKATVNFLRKKSNFYKNKNNIVIMQCTSSYPSEDNELNLNVIDNYKSEFNYVIGYSDHSIGNLALLIAYIKGAQVLEFHFTDNKNKVFRDHKISLDSEDLKKLIIEIKKINQMLGKYKKVPTKNEVKSGHIKSFRRSLYLKEDIKKGEIINLKNLVALRPEHSTKPVYFEKFINKIIAKKNYKKFDRI
jgi:N,N'-diacetyllegionaminate synthase